jgi:hypothetical protein
MKQQPVWLAMSERPRFTYLLKTHEHMRLLDQSIWTSQGYHFFGSCLGGRMHESISRANLLLSECSSYPSPWINCFTLLTHNPKKQDAIKVFKWSNHGQIIRRDQWKIDILGSFSSFSDTIMWSFGKWNGYPVSKTQQHYIVELHSHFGFTVPPLEMLLEEPNPTRHSSV